MFSQSRVRDRRRDLMSVGFCFCHQAHRERAASCWARNAFWASLSLSIAPAARLVGLAGVGGGVAEGLAEGSAWPWLARSSCVSSVRDRKSTRLNSSHVKISYAVFY